jgi:hypothetical protein
MCTDIYHASRKLTLREAAELISRPPTSPHKDEINFIRSIKKKKAVKKDRQPPR